MCCDAKTLQLPTHKPRAGHPRIPPTSCTAVLCACAEHALPPCPKPGAVKLHCLSFPLTSRSLTTWGRCALSAPSAWLPCLPCWRCRPQRRIRAARRISPFQQNCNVANSCSCRAGDSLGGLLMHAADKARHARHGVPPRLLIQDGNDGRRLPALVDRLQLLWREGLQHAWRAPEPACPAAQEGTPGAPALPPGRGLPRR